MIARLLDLTGFPARRVALSVGLGALAVCFGAGLMGTAGYLISRAAEQPPILSLTVAIVAVRFFGLARPLARYLERLASHDVALRGLARARLRFYERIVPLAPAQLDCYRRGELLGRMVGDVEALQGLTLRALGPPLTALLAGGACVAATAVLVPPAALVLAAGLALAGLAVPAVAPPQRQAPARGALSAELVELLRGAPELVAYGRADDALARVRARDAEVAAAGRRDALGAGLADALSLLVVGLTVTGVLAVAIAARPDRVLVAAVGLLALASFEAVAPLPAAARELRALRVSGARVLELTDAVPAVREPTRPLPPPPARPVVALERVTGPYGVAGFDLRLEPGSRVALVGASGAGKTTVTQLLLRFVDPERGRVTIAGRDARDYRLADVRGTFALAGQDAHLFATTIRANLALARPGASDDELRAALALARLDLPLDTRVGEEGTQLSGGQRQRVVVARALLADTPVLLLDEPTAHLDHETAEALIDDVLDAAGDRAVLLITHRGEGLDRMDEVVTLVRSG